MKIFFVICLALTSSVFFGDNLLTDGSFEETVPEKKLNRRIELFREWDCILGSGSEKCSVELSMSGASGKQAIRIRTLGKYGCTSVIHKKIFPVSPGDEVAASVMMKGHGIGYCRVYFIGPDGKRIRGKYKMRGCPAKPDFSPLLLKFTVPDGVSWIQFALETLRDDADVVFDDAKLVISPGDILENAAIRLAFAPRLGGGISSFFWKEKNFEFTSSKTLTQGGNMVNCIIPAQWIPGVFYNIAFDRISRTKESISYAAQLTSGPLAGLRMTKNYTLLPDGVKLEIILANKGEETRQISWRIQNFISSAPGVWSWPTPDWVTIFCQTGKPLNGLKAVVQDLFRAGWEAKFYESLQAILLFEFDVQQVRRLYCYFNMPPEFSTAEWYLREFQLAPGAEKKVTAAIRVIRKAEKHYTDDRGALQKTEEIKPVEMPEPPQNAILPPAHFKDYFPYVGGGGNLNLPEMAGSLKPMSYPESFARITPRLFRIQTDAYINSFATPRLIYGMMHKHLWMEDGKHILGEMCRRLELRYYLATLFLYRNDVDVAKYMKEKWPKMHRIMTDPSLRKFITAYPDRIPVIYTADELLPQNVDVMLKVHEELKKLLPEHIVPLPYLHSAAVDILPYVPAFIGDWYPIKRADASGRNPWSVYAEFSSLVKRAGKTPVWFMPQGFARRDLYALPTAGETRLMLHLAIAAGVKGIAWHGFPSSTWSWMMNFDQYRYSFLGAAGQRSPSWPGVVSVGRTIASVGPLLSVAAPVPLPESVKVSCEEFTSHNNFYSGPAVRAYALKTPKGLLILAVNQNPVKNEKCTIILPKEKAFELVSLRELEQAASFELEPGGIACIYCGGDSTEVEKAFASRFRAERARYLLRADLAKGFGVKTVDPDSFRSRSQLKGLRALLKEQQELEKRLASGKIGLLLADLEATRKTLDDIEFRLCCSLDIAVTDEMRRKTRRFARWTPHSDKNFEKIRRDLAEDFACFYRISDAVESGGGVKAAEGIGKLRQRVEKDVAAVRAWLEKHPQKKLIDDPYAY